MSYGVFASKEEHDEWMREIHTAKAKLELAAIEAEAKRDRALADAAHTGLEVAGFELPEWISAPLSLALRGLGFLPVALPLTSIPPAVQEKLLEASDVFRTIVRGLGVK